MISLLEAAKRESSRDLALDCWAAMTIHLFHRGVSECRVKQSALLLHELKCQGYGFFAQRNP